ncbi:hypothetical protein D3C87_1128550 [compost metagenome]
MLIDQILMHMALVRGLRLSRMNTPQFELRAALDSDKPVIFWHTSNGIDYLGYELLPTDGFGSHVPFGHLHDKIERYVASGKVHGICNSFFLEYDGVLVKATDIWPVELVAYLGDGMVDRYRVGVSMEHKQVPI